MKKYTIKEFAEGKKAVKIENEEQWNKLNKVHELCNISSRNFGEYFNNVREWCNGEWYKDHDYKLLEFSQLDFEDEFVVGKWYKLPKTSNYYAKYKTMQACSEYISNTGSHSHWDGNCNFEDAIKIDLSEIQQYLPENHPDLIKKDTFVLPKYWFLKITPENKAIVNEWKLKQRLNADLFKNPVYTYVNQDGGGRYNANPDDKKFITFEQFKTHVLKESTMQEIKEGSQFKVSRESDNTIYTFNRIEGDNVVVTWGTAHRVHYYLSNCLDNIKDGSWILVNKEKTMEKEILRYKLVKPEFIDAANSLLINSKFVNPSTMDMYQACNIEAMKKAGVLDLWFEPVYAPQIQLPTINGYQGSYKSGIIKYGCAEFSKMFFEHLNSTNSHLGNRTIKSIKLSSDVEITIEEIKQIVEYINKK